MRDLFQYLKDLGHPASMTEIKNGIGLRWKTLSKRLNELVTAGAVARTGSGTPSDPVRFTPVLGPEEVIAWPISRTQIPNPSGAADTLTTRPAPNAREAVPLRASDSPRTTDTHAGEDTAAAETLMPGTTPWSMIPAASTTSRSSANTVWSVSPQRLIEEGLRVSTDDLRGLPERTREKLLRLAEGRSEPPEAVVGVIAEYFVEAEDGRAEGPLGEAVVWYLDNEYW